MPNRSALILALLGMFALSSPALAASRCIANGSGSAISCSIQTVSIDSGAEAPRKVVFQVPTGTAPAGGWPVVLLFHGSLVQVNGFTYTANMPFGGLYQGMLIRALLDNGYAVIAPNALTAAEAWQTNEPEYAYDYAHSNDRLFFENLFAAMNGGRFGKLDASRWYAVGISSGGYNTSRMAVSFPGRFKALAIQSASFATCVGARCQVPQELPADHPATLFLHGLADRVVPWSSMQPYHDRLLYQGIETALYSEPTGGHQWFAASPAKILDWFQRHP
ncbi:MULTISPECIES: alpha/beta hydrolase-fold protein [unclassified Pseudomonas]|uniref:extracellular medium-chain-length polyhydroxyalkanoate depolymerase n=1 Tax=unclassified Pseudomonas TaxID=196821 RepID=UPI00244793C0|nr:MULTISPECIES: alpha/beta hydrolase-fold protein [unclassified Pseudomonas]MDG9930162.1 plasmid partitioning protein [Pseudomonas sp. GD04042]MDH0485795.1 plasmid partitioning protein [Pseudomonas sp. GD04015]MDH0606802.1 plasmid partitioning protein [Pseudomonas sp. GD03869]